MPGRVQVIDPMSTPRSPSQIRGLWRPWTLNLGHWTMPISPAGGSTSGAGGRSPLPPGRWRALPECDRPTRRTSGASSARPDNRSGSARNSPPGLRLAGNGSWSWLSWQVPFVRSAIGADQMRRGVRRVERLSRRGTSCRFAANFLQMNCVFLGIRREETRMASFRTARFETSPPAGNSPNGIQALSPRKSRGPFRGAIASSRKDGTPAESPRLQNGRACTTISSGNRSIVS